MAKVKEPAKSFFSPKKGEVCVLKPSKKTKLAQAVDNLSKLKTKTLLIGPHKIMAISDTCIMEADVQLGVICEVDTKAFKNAVNDVGEFYSVTLNNNTLEFSWGEGNLSSAIVDIPEKPFEFEHGVILEEIRHETFPSCLYYGGAFVGPNKDLVFGRTYVKSGLVVSSDNIGLSVFDYPHTLSPPFSVSSEVLALWESVNLPMSSLEIYENHICLNLSDLRIWDISDQKLEVKFGSNVFNKLTQFQQFIDHSFIIDDEFWKSLSAFKHCNEITLSNDKIRSNDNAVLEKTVDLKIFEDDTDTFTVKYKDFIKLKKLVTNFSNCSIIQIPNRNRIDKYIIINVDPGETAWVVLGGMAEEINND